MNQKGYYPNATIAVGVVSMMVTASVFFLLTGGDRLPIHWWGLGFMLAAELLSTVAVIATGLMGQTGKVYRPTLLTGAYAVAMFYAVASVACALAFMVLLPGSVRTLIAIQIILFAACLVFLILLLNASFHIARGVAATQAAANTLDALVARADAALRAAAGKPYAADLDRLYEALRFSDHSTATPTDHALSAQFDALDALLGQGAGEEDIKGQVAGMMSMVERRTAEVRSRKMGSV